MKKPTISFIIPIYNEQNNIKLLYYEIKKVMIYLKKKKKFSNYEVIFIDDGSRDNTPAILKSIKKTEGKRLRVVAFRKNFGKAEAYKAGFEICSGDLVFTMDGDLQDNPNDIPAFLEKINQGYDIVIGWKYKRRDPMTKRFLSKIFNNLLRSLTKLKLHDFDNGFRCMKKEILPHLDLYEGLYRYIPLLANSKGFHVGEVKVHHRERKYGQSKYGASRISGGFFDLITIKFLFFYLKRPLHFFGGIGFVIFLIGFLGVCSLIYSILRNITWETPLLTLSVLLIIIGIQFILFGLIGEMIANISKKEKNYVIRKII